LKATLEVISMPPGADIELDGKFVGNTPSSLFATPGDHTIKLTKSGYNTWERKLTTSSGTVKISPELESIFIRTSAIQTVAPQTNAAAPEHNAVPHPSAPVPTVAVANPTPQAQPEPEAKLELTVTSDPAGAAVEVNGVSVGATPVTVALTPGATCSIAVKKDGFVLWKMAYPTSAAGKYNLNANLTKEVFR